MNKPLIKLLHIALASLTIVSTQSQAKPALDGALVKAAGITSLTSGTLLGLIKLAEAKKLNIIKNIMKKESGAARLALAKKILAATAGISATAATGLAIKNLLTEDAPTKPIAPAPTDTPDVAAQKALAEKLRKEAEQREQAQREEEKAKREAAERKAQEEAEALQAKYGERIPALTEAADKLKAAFKARKAAREADPALSKVQTKEEYAAKLATHNALSPEDKATHNAGLKAKLEAAEAATTFNGHVEKTINAIKAISGYTAGRTHDFPAAETRRHRKHASSDFTEELMAQAVQAYKAAAKTKVEELEAAPVDASETPEARRERILDEANKAGQEAFKAYRTAQIEQLEASMGDLQLVADAYKTTTPFDKKPDDLRALLVGGMTPLERDAFINKPENASLKEKDIFRLANAYESACLMQSLVAISRVSAEQRAEAEAAVEQTWKAYTDALTEEPLFKNAGIKVGEDTANVADFAIAQRNLGRAKNQLNAWQASQQHQEQYLKRL